MEELSDMQQNSEVDINVLVNLYHTKLAAALNQNVLLEAKLQTLKNDYEKEKQLLLEEIANLSSEPGAATNVYINKPHWTSTLDGGTF